MLKLVSRKLLGDNKLLLFYKGNYKSYMFFFFLLKELPEETFVNFFFFFYYFLFFYVHDVNKYIAFI